jgi:hypothetical protein
MQRVPEHIDLTAEPESRRGLVALAAVRGLTSGRAIVLRTSEDPGLLMESLNVQLRGALHWESAPSDRGWETLVRRAEDVPATDVVGLLVRDHRRLDELLAKALRRLNSGDTAAARPLLDAFADGLRRHARAEDEVVARALGPEAGFAPLETMLREHEELLVQLDAVEQCLVEAPAGALPDAWEVEPLVAILSGTLAKHEHREEQGLFPAWSARLAARPSGERDALLASVKARLDAGTAER